MVALGIPAALILMLLMLPFFDRRRIRSPRHRPTPPHQEIEEVAEYLASLRGPEGLKQQPEYRDTFPEPVTPKEKP